MSSAILYGLTGAGAALSLSTIGAAFGTAKSVQNYSPTASSSSSWKLTIIPFIPVIIAGVLAIYGLIYSVIVLSAVGSTGDDYSYSRGYNQFVGGLTVGFCCLFSGIAVGVTGNKGLKDVAENNEKSAIVKMVLNLVYCEALGLYGLIFGLIASSY